MFESVIPYWEVENGELTKLLLLPIEEHFALPRSRNGWPKKDTASNIIERFAEMSKPWGVDIKIENGTGVVQL
jgi:poly-gamma-glutamate synthesis protein (capsule biosynthesis protein)